MDNDTQHIRKSQIRGVLPMRKIYVEELSSKSQKLFKELAKAHSDVFNNEDIENGLMSKISELRETEYFLGFRSCTNKECCEFFKTGFLFAGDKPFCSKHCIHEFLPDTNNDFETETIILKNWIA